MKTSYQNFYKSFYLSNLKGIKTQNKAYLFFRFEDCMINDLSWNELKLVSSQDTFFPAIADTEKLNYFLMLPFLSLFCCSEGGPPNQSLCLWPRVSFNIRWWY